MSQTVNPATPSGGQEDRLARLCAASPAVAAFVAASPRRAGNLGSAPRDLGLDGWKGWLAHQLLPSDLVADDGAPPDFLSALADHFVTSKSGLDLKAALHEARQRAILLIIERALGGASEAETGHALAALASATIDLALLGVDAELSANLGRPLTHDGSPCVSVVMALGELGGAELSFGAPVELLYVYQTDRGRVGSAGAALDLHTYFSRLFERLTAVLVDPTPGPFGFSVQLGARPEGQRGSICNSVDALESYYESFGHAWERLAWVKARPVAGSLALGRELTASLRPFVFRRHLDDALRGEIVAMKRRNDAGTSGIRDVDLFDLRASSGALGQIYFAVQTTQLVWAGQRPSLRVESTDAALAAAAIESVITAHDAHDLRAARAFFQAALNMAALAGLKPQVALSDAAGGQDALGRHHLDLVALGAHRAAVEAVYATTAESLQPTALPSDAETRLVTFLEPDAPQAARIEAARALGFYRPEMTLRTIDSLARRPQSPFHWRARTQESPLASLAHRIVSAALSAANPDEALRHFEAFLRVVERRGKALVQLADDPERLRVLATLFGASHKLSGMLVRAPGLIDRLVLAGHEPPFRTPAEIDALFADESTLHPEGWEGTLASVRRAHAAEILRIGFFDLAGRLDTHGVTAQLTAVAEAAINTVVRAAMRDIAARFDVPIDDFGVLAGGRLAGREVGYDSPLELVFVHGPALDVAIATRLARAVVTGLTCATPEGAPYEIAGQGEAGQSGGPLCVSRARFLQFHRDEAGIRGRATALRLRILMDAPQLGALVDEVRRLASGAFGGAQGAVAQALLAAKDGVGALGVSPLDTLDAIGQFCELTTEGRPPGLTARASDITSSFTFGILRDFSGLGADAKQPTGLSSALADAWVFMRQLENRLAVVQERPGESARLLNEAARSVGTPASDALRRLCLRLGLAQGGTAESPDTIQAYIADYQRHRATIDSVTSNILRRNHHGH